MQNYFCYFRWWMTLCTKKSLNTLERTKCLYLYTQEKRQAKLHEPSETCVLRETLWDISWGKTRRVQKCLGKVLLILQELSTLKKFWVHYRAGKITGIFYRCASRVVFFQFSFLPEVLNIRSPSDSTCSYVICTHECTVVQWLNQKVVSMPRLYGAQSTIFQIDSDILLSREELILACSKRQPFCSGQVTWWPLCSTCLFCHTFKIC